MFLGQLALSKAQDSQIQWLAKQIVQDHTAANRQLIQAVEAITLRLPPTNAFAMAVKPKDVQPVREPESQPQRPTETPAQVKVEPKDVQTAERLQSLSGQAFDQAFIQAMIKDHQESIRLFQQAQNLPDQKLRDFAQQTLPKLQYHLQHAQKRDKTAK